MIRIICHNVILMMLVLTSILSAQGEPKPVESGFQGGFIYGPERGDGTGEGIPLGPSYHGHHSRFGKKGMRGPGGLQFKQFRKEIRELGHEIKKNEMLIQSLEEELAAVGVGVRRAEIRKKLNECRLREAVLQVVLAQKRVDFTRRARDMAQARYDQARLAMEKVKEKIFSEYPDLADRMAMEMPPPTSDFFPSPTSPPAE